MPKQKATANSVVNGRTTVHVDHSESSGLLHPNNSLSTADIQLPVPGSSSSSAVAATRYGSSPGRAPSPARKPSIASTTSSTWKLKYQDFMPQDSPCADSWTNTESFQ